MSIFPVRLSKWFKPNGTHEERCSYDMARTIVQLSKCYQCGKKKIQWHYAWGYHAICYGFSEVWCTKKCYEEWQKK